MVVGTASYRPMKLAIGFFDLEIVNARIASHHIAVFVELPVLVAIGAKPLVGSVTTLISEAHRNLIVGKGP